MLLPQEQAAHAFCQAFVPGLAFPEPSLQTAKAALHYPTQSTRKFVEKCRTTAWKPAFNTLDFARKAIPYTGEAGLAFARLCIFGENLMLANQIY